MNVEILSLGQSGFVLKGSGGTVVIDPYLSNAIDESGSEPRGRWARSFEPPVAPNQLKGIDLVLSTHIHGDHCDRATIEGILGANPDAKVWGPYPVRAALAEWELGERIGMKDLDVTVVPSSHYGFDADESGEAAYAGYVVDLDGVRIYHAGDTSLYDGMAERLAPLKIDVALLPVNGRDAVRERIGIVGNTDAREAFWLAEAIGSPIVVPMHNDLFAINRVPWSNVWDTRDALYPNLRCHRLLPGERMIVSSF